MRCFRIAAFILSSVSKLANTAHRFEYSAYDLHPGNSLKYTQNGTVAVVLSSNSAEHNPVIELIIQDTGIGMSRQFVTSGLYTPYKQANSNSTGLGLGLSIVKQIVKGEDPIPPPRATSPKDTAGEFAMAVLTIALD